MALHKLKIIVYDGGKASGGMFGSVDSKDDSKDDNKDGGKKKNDKSLLSKVLNYNQTIRSKVQQATSPTTFFAIQQGVSVAVQAGREAINYYVRDIGRSTGDSNYQAIINRRIEKVTDALSLGQGALGGAAAGAALGPIGAAVGAVFGLISSGISLGAKHAERKRAYQHEMFKENTSQAYQLARANYSALTGRIR